MLHLCARRRRWRTPDCLECPMTVDSNSVSRPRHRMSGSTSRPETPSTQECPCRLAARGSQTIAAGPHVQAHPDRAAANRPIGNSWRRWGSDPVDGERPPNMAPRSSRLPRRGMLASETTRSTPRLYSRTSSSPVQVATSSCRQESDVELGLTVSRPVGGIRPRRGVGRGVGLSRAVEQGLRGESCRPRRKFSPGHVRTRGVTTTTTSIFDCCFN